MPYPNEASCVLIPVTEANTPITCRRTKRISNNKEYGIITCRYEKPPFKKSHWAEQSLRYPVAIWSQAEARKHCKKAGGRFEAAKEKVEKTDLSFMSKVRKREIIRLEDGSGIFVKEG